MAVVEPLLEELDVTDAQWVEVSRCKAVCQARQRATKAFRKLGWTTAAIAKAIGFDPQSVRRMELAASGATPARRSHARKVRLPLVIEGRAMRATAGPRHDCIYDGACLQSLLAAFPRANPPQHASCPPACQWLTPPDRDQARYDATRRPG